MKQIMINILGILFVLSLVSCDTAETVEQIFDEPTVVVELTANDKYKMSDLTDSAYYLGEDVHAVFPYRDKFYKAGNELGYYDIFEDMAYTKLCDLPESKECNIYVNDAGIYYFDGATLSRFGFDGTMIEEYKINDGDTRYFQVQVCAVENYILACSARRTEPDAATFDYSIYTIEKSTGEIKEYPMGQQNTLDSILALEPGKKADRAIMLKSCRLGGSAEEIYVVYTLDAEKGKITEEYVYDSASAIGGADYIPEDNRFYGFIRNTYVKTEGSFRLAFADYDDAEFTGYRNISGTTAFKPIKSAVVNNGGELHRMNFILHPYHFFTGYDYICLDIYNKSLCVFSGNPVSSGQSLTILYPSQTVRNSHETEGNYLDSAVIRPNLEFEEMHDVAVKTKTYALEEFHDRLRMKLLAGDTDYDIVYLDQAEELLAHILRYGLYLPLEEYSEIVSSFEHYLTGIKDIMSYDGHIYGVPYILGGLSFTVQETYHMLDLPALAGAYSFDDFWKVCEKVKEEGSGKSLAIDFYLFCELMKAIIEDGAEKGKLDETAVYDTIEKFVEYSNAGVITEWIDGNFLLNHIYTFSKTGVKMLDYKSSFREMIAYPSYNGKTYIPVESMIYANSLTQNTELSVKYLAMLMTEEFAAEAELKKSNIWKDKTAYFVFPNSGINEASLIELEYKLPRIPAGFSEYDSYLIDNVGNALINVAPNLYSEGMDDFLYSIFINLADNKISPQEASEKICQEANYRIME